MQTGFPEQRASVPRYPRNEVIAVLAVVIVAAFLRLWHLEKVEFGNEYYAAAVRSMLVSGKNFFFASFDPVGIVSVDKPPVAFWVQAIFAKVFGYHPISLMLPQALAGIGSVALLYRLIRPTLGAGAGVLAALFQAVNPMSVAVDRTNNPDSLLVFTLLLAAWFAFRYTETGRLAPLLATAFWLGVAFNIKMLAAFIILPTLALLCLLPAENLPHLRVRLAQVGAATLLLVAVSLGWAVTVDRTPASQRPYVGGSTTNSALELALGYNGLGRVLGQGPKGGPGRPGGPDGMPFRSGMMVASLNGDGGMPPGMPGMGFGPPPMMGGPGGPGGPGRADFGGEPGPLRLAQTGLVDQFAWTVPLAILGLIAGLLQTSFRLPLSASARQYLLWAGWGITHAAVFSAARGIFHPYYLSAIAPAVSALTGIGLVALWTAYRNGNKGQWLFLLAALLLTGVSQASILSNFPEWSQILTPLVLGGTLISLTALILIDLYQPRFAPHLLLAAVIVSIAAQLLSPIAWAGTVTFTHGMPMMPTAGPTLLQGPGRGPRMGPGGMPGGMGGPGNNPKLISYLQSQRGNERILLASGSAKGTGGIIARTGYPIVAVGGFNGNDPALSLEAFQELTQRGEVAFVLIEGERPMGPPSSHNPIFQWVREVGTLVSEDLWRESSGRMGMGMGELYDVRGVNSGRWSVVSGPSRTGSR